MTSLKVLRGLNKSINSRYIHFGVNRTFLVFEQQTNLIPRVLFSTTDVFNKKGKNKPKPGKPVIDDLLEAVEDEEEEDEEAAFRDTAGQKESELKSLLSQQSRGKKTSKGSTNMSYAEFSKVVAGEQLWNDLDSTIENLKNVYLHQLSVRSASSIGRFP